MQSDVSATIAATVAMESASKGATVNHPAAHSGTSDGGGDGGGAATMKDMKRATRTTQVIVADGSERSGSEGLLSV